MRVASDEGTRLFERFQHQLDEEVVRIIEELPRVPENYLKHMEDTDGLYEIRVQFGNNIFHIFCFFDDEQLVVLANGYQKKSTKTAKKEIEVALKINAEYETQD